MMKAQLENGHTRIANDMEELLAKLKISNYESRFLWALFRKTYGFQKKEDRIALSQFSKMTNISSQHIARTKKKLLDKNIIFQHNGKIGIQTELSKWVLPNEVLPKQVRGTTQTGSKTLPKQVDTKEKKETIQKKGKIFISADSFFSSFKEINNNKTILKAKYHDLREKDIVYFANQMYEWCIGKEVEDKKELDWDSFFNKWIFKAVDQYHDRTRLSDKEEKAKPTLTKQQKKEAEFYDKLIIR